MRIGINARQLCHPNRRGVNRYTHGLLRGLSRRDDLELFLFTDAPIHPSFREGVRAEEVLFRSRRHALWEQLALPRRLKDLKIDVFHAPANWGLPYQRVCGYVLTIHDVIGRAWPHDGARVSLKARLKGTLSEAVSVARAARVITVSEHSRRDILRHLHVPEARVSVIYEAADETYHQVTDSSALAHVRRTYGIEGPYVLYVGGFEPRKNVGALIQAMALLWAEIPTLTAVLAGADTDDRHALEALAKRLGVASAIRFVGYVPEGDLPALYSGAAAFVYPSLYEGFGLQPVEAMACGVPVLASNRTSLPEVLKGAGLLFDPEDVQQVVETIHRVLTDEALASRLREQGMRRAKEFSWDWTAEETYRVYAAVLEAG